MGGRDIHQEIQYRSGARVSGESYEFSFGYIAFGVIHETKNRGNWKSA